MKNIKYTISILSLTMLFSSFSAAFSVLITNNTRDQIDVWSEAWSDLLKTAGTPVGPAKLNSGDQQSWDFILSNTEFVKWKEKSGKIYQVNTSQYVQNIFFDINGNGSWRISDEHSNSIASGTAPASSQKGN
jgi:hypothetical protein